MSPGTQLPPTTTIDDVDSVSTASHNSSLLRASVYFDADAATFPGLHITDDESSVSSVNTDQYPPPTVGHSHNLQVSTPVDPDLDNTLRRQNFQDIFKTFKSMEV